MRRNVWPVITAFLVALCFLFPADRVAAQTSGEGEEGRYAGGRSGAGYVMVNPLGFLQFGPILEGAYRVGSETYIGAHLRFSGLGILYHVVNGDPSSEESFVSPVSIGPGITVVSLFPYSESAHRFYGGGVLGMDFGWSNGTDSVGEWEARWSSVVAAVNFGHRWRYSSNMFLNVGLIAGGSLDLSSTWNYVDEPDELNDDSSGAFYGMFELAVGWELGE